jgi:hypothetical protein
MNLTCEIEFLKSPHTFQLYNGLSKLQSMGLVDVKYKKTSDGNINKPIVRALVNNKFKVVYDMLDGLNWISGSSEENFEWFRKEFSDVDFYFKRSFSSAFAETMKDVCKVLPLGLNYPMHYDHKISIVHQLKNFINYHNYNNSLLAAEMFEHGPVINDPIKILFQTRLWNPDDTKTISAKQDRKNLNENRIACIDACKEEFGELFTGGLTKDAFSTTMRKDLCIQNSHTDKVAYLRQMKKHSICIATTGLYGSIGWKFGEYIAASRTVISEPLEYAVPGNLERDVHYLEFTDPASLIKSIRTLMNDRSKLQQMMNVNNEYYNNYVKPEKLLLNSLMKIYEPAPSHMHQQASTLNITPNVA